jgi:hypothetical protein
MARKSETSPETSPETSIADGADPLVNIVITADHVYLPLGDDGNAHPEWRDIAGWVEAMPDLSLNQREALVRKHDARPVKKRTRLLAPTALATFLSERDQAEIL